MIFTLHIKCVNRKEIVQKRRLIHNQPDEFYESATPFNRVAYIDTDKLSPKERVFFDIAYWRYQKFNDSSLFLSILNFFSNDKNSVDVDNTKHKHVAALDNYFEDENGNPLTIHEYRRLLGVRSLKETIEMHQDIFEDFLMRPPEYDNIKPEQIHLTPNDIKQLKALICLVQKLHGSPFCRAKLEITYKGNKWCLNKTFSNSQLDSAILKFRQLSMETESTYFDAIVNIVCNPQKIEHPIRQEFVKQRAEYRKIVNMPISSLDLILNKAIAPQANSIVPTCLELIKAGLYTGMIHQGKTDDWAAKTRIMDLLKSEEVFQYAFFVLIRKLLNVMVITMSDMIKVLWATEQDLSTHSDYEPTNQEISFCNFLQEKKHELASYICEENGQTASKVKFYLESAKQEIIDRFKFPENVFGTNL